MTEPAWERLRAPDHRPLRVGPIRRVDVEELRVVDGSLPDHDASIVFDAWPTEGGVCVRAAAMRDTAVFPWEIRAAQLRIEDSDGRLEALLAGSGRVAVAGELERPLVPVPISVLAAFMAPSGWRGMRATGRRRGADR